MANLLVTGLALVAFALPTASLVSGDQPETPRAEAPDRAHNWPPEAPRAEAPDHRTHSWVPEDRTLYFGRVPLEHVTDAATTAAVSAQCDVTPASSTAMVLAMTWPEVSPGGGAPSPMTLSRWDNQPALGDPLGRARGLWFHPGIGMWQLDSAGLGADLTASEAMDSELVAQRIAPYIMQRYCERRNAGDDSVAARAYAWRAWHACGDGACEDVYQRALTSVAPVDDVGQHGGADPRTCWFQGAAHECTFVDPSAAEGSAWWARESTGRSPVAAPFYVLRWGIEPVAEVRYWLAADAGATEDVVARRALGVNARHGLDWQTGPGMCDLSEWRGDC